MVPFESSVSSGFLPLLLGSLLTAAMLALLAGAAPYALPVDNALALGCQARPRPRLPRAPSPSAATRALALGCHARARRIHNMRGMRHARHAHAHTHATCACACHMRMRMPHAHASMQHAMTCDMHISFAHAHAHATCDMASALSVSGHWSECERPERLSGGDP
eukprot:6009504-Prymnesium_polylepis.1